MINDRWAVSAGAGAFIGVILAIGVFLVAVIAFAWFVFF